MKRRQFIAILSTAAATLPLGARAQQPSIPVMGLLLAGLPEKTTHILEVIRLGLGEAGFFEGQNLAIEYRFANARLEQLPSLADDLVRRRVSLILAGPRTEMAVKAATSSIPIVFMSGVDPVRIGLVPSINRPGGNITGVTLMSNDLEAKRIGLLHELLPHAKSMAYLNETNHPEAAFRAQQVELAGRNLSIPIRVASVANENEFEEIFAAFSRDRIDALIVGASIYLVNMRDQLVKLAAQYRIPTIYEIRDFAEVGGLMSYAASVTDAWRQAAVYAGRILKGARPDELPVQQPTRFELIINLNTAKALGLTVPPMLLARADEVIE